MYFKLDSEGNIVTDEKVIAQQEGNTRISSKVERY